MRRIYKSWRLFHKWLWNPPLDRGYIDVSMSAFAFSGIGIWIFEGFKGSNNRIEVLEKANRNVND
jgi:hypothetical protein